MNSMYSVKSIKKQGAFTMIEVLVSSLLLSVGILALLGALSSANQANNVTQRVQSASELAQRELEKIDDLTYEQLSLTQAPGNSSDPNDPGYRVSGTQFEWQDGLFEDLVIGLEDAAVNPGPETFSVGGATAQVYRYVTWVDAPDYETCTEDCGRTQDYKRVIVAVKMVSPAFRGFDKYVEESTLRINPNLGPGGQISQPDDPNPGQAADNFYLYDTPNDSCTGTTYQQPVGDHTTHDTRGACDSGTGDYPDLMGIDLPPNPYDPDLPPFYKYSTDVPGTYEDGLAITQRNGCVMDGAAATEVHTWTTNPISAQPYDLSGKVSFDFWSATSDGSNGTGEICVGLYDRLVTGGAPQDTPIQTATYTLPNWPTEPANLSFTFTHAQYTLPAGNRLRFILMVSSNSDSDLQFQYDHPSSPSFIQVQTTTPISE